MRSSRPARLRSSGRGKSSTSATRSSWDCATSEPKRLAHPITTTSNFTMPEIDNLVLKAAQLYPAIGWMFQAVNRPRWFSWPITAARWSLGAVLVKLSRRSSTDIQAGRRYKHRPGSVIRRCVKPRIASRCSGASSGDAESVTGAPRPATVESQRARRCHGRRDNSPTPERPGQLPIGRQSYDGVSKGDLQSRFSTFEKESLLPLALDNAGSGKDQAR